MSEDGDSVDSASALRSRRCRFEPLYTKKFIDWIRETWSNWAALKNILKMGVLY